MYRMIEEFKGVDIDGSGKITICAHHVRLVPGEEKYICDHEFHISVYYLEQEEIDAIENAANVVYPQEDSILSPLRLHIRSKASVF